ncbi:MAG: TolC family protein, partial [Candidatus Marinimicrobia bacterium]|nr:TolC family protein [Candidatus Neomarinimicrobiota bacterium]
MVLTEEQLIAMALMNSYKLQSMQTNIDIAEYRYRSSGRLDNPELRYRDISLSEREKKYKDQQIGLRFSIPKPGELKEERQGSKVRLWDKKVDKERYQQKLAARIRRDVADIIMYDQLLDLAAKRVAIEDRRIEIVEKMVEIGQRSVVYFTKAKMWHAESKNDYARAKQYRIQARSKLSKHTGVDPDVAIMWPEIPEISCDLADLITIALQNRPEIERLNQRIELAGYQNRLERLKVLPWFNYIEMNYHFEREQRVDWLELMMGISIPLLDWNHGNRQATDLAIRKKELEYNA